MSNTVRMIRTDDGKTGDIHPDEVEHMIKHGWQVVDPLDHDGDGKPGGSAAPEHTDELAALRAQYADLYGKRPFMGWDAKTLTAKIDEKLAQ